jgi:hypothetical protein
LFVYICIVIVDPIIKKAEGGDPILQFTADTFLIAPKSNFVYNGLVQRRHHYHLVNKKQVLPFGHLELNNNHSLNILVTAMPIQNHCNKT